MHHRKLKMSGDKGNLEDEILGMLMLMLWSSLINNIANLGCYAMRTTLCITCVIPSLQILDIVGKYGLVVISRYGHNPEKFIYESDNLMSLKVCRCEFDMMTLVI